jgi:hypothetical protein
VGSDDQEHMQGMKGNEWGNEMRNTRLICCACDGRKDAHCHDRTHRDVTFPAHEGDPRAEIQKPQDERTKER